MYTTEKPQSTLSHPQPLHYSEYFHILEFPKNQHQFKANLFLVRFKENLKWYQLYHNNINLFN